MTTTRIEDEIRDYLKTTLLSPLTILTKFYIGKIEPDKIPASDMPVLMIYETDEDLDTKHLTTAQDCYTYNVTIQVVLDAFAYVSSAGIETDKILLAQRALKDLFSARDANGKPNAATILGVLRTHILGNTTVPRYLFSSNIKIHYDGKNVDGKQYLIGTLTLTGITAYNVR